MVVVVAMVVVAMVVVATVRRLVAMEVAMKEAKRSQAAAGAVMTARRREAVRLASLWAVEPAKVARSAGNGPSDRWILATGRHMMEHQQRNRQ